MDDLVKAVQALALAFERRGLEPPTIKVTQRASSAIAREIAPMLCAEDAGSTLQNDEMRIAGIKIGERYTTNLGETFYGDHPKTPLMTCAGNYRETSYRDGLPISRLFGGGLFGG